MATSTYTLSDLISDVRLIFPSSDQFTDAQIKRHANWTIDDIAHNVEVPELEAVYTGITLSTNVREYALPSDLFYIKTVKNTTDDYLLQQITLAEAETFEEDYADEPTAYAIRGTTLLIYPLPSSSYNGDTLRINYVKVPTKFDKDTDTSPFPAYYDEALYQGTLFRLYRSNDEPERAQAAFAIYRGILNSRQSVRAKDVWHASVGASPNVPYIAE